MNTWNGSKNNRRIILFRFILKVLSNRSDRWMFFQCIFIPVASTVSENYKANRMQICNAIKIIRTFFEEKEEWDAYSI